MMPLAPIQVSPTMWWTKPEPNFSISPDVIVSQRFCPEGQWPTRNGGCRELPGTSVPAWLAEGAVGLAAVDPTAVATGGVAIGSLLAGTLVRGVLGYFIGKWTGSSKGWTAAGAAILGVPGTAASVYFTKKDRVKSNRKGKKVSAKSRRRKAAMQKFMGGIRAAKRSGGKIKVEFHPGWNEYSAAIQTRDGINTIGRGPTREAAIADAKRHVASIRRKR